VSPSSLGLGPDRIGASVVFFLKLQRLSKTYAIHGECSRTLFFRLVRPARRSPAARPVVARVVTDFVNLFRTARIDPLHVGIAPCSGCSPLPLPGDTRQRSRRIIPCGALRVVHRAGAPPMRDSFSLLEVGAERRGAARNRARIAPPNFGSGGRPRRRRTDLGACRAYCRVCDGGALGGSPRRRSRRSARPLPAAGNNGMPPKRPVPSGCGQTARLRCCSACE